MSKKIGIVLLSSSLGIGAYAWSIAEDQSQRQAQVAEASQTAAHGVGETNRVISAHRPLIAPSQGASATEAPAFAATGRKDESQPPRVVAEARPAAKIAPGSATITVSADGKAAPEVAIPKPAPIIVQAPRGPAGNGEEARRSLTREIQKELARVGCYDGELDGQWSSATRKAMSSFTERVNATLPIESPDFILLTLVQGHGGRACGRTCPAGQALTDGDRCLPRALVAGKGQKAKSSDGQPAGIAPAAKSKAESAEPKAAAAAPLPGRMAAGAVDGLSEGAGAKAAVSAAAAAERALAENAAQARREAAAEQARIEARRRAQIAAAAASADEKLRAEAESRRRAEIAAIEERRARLEAERRARVAAETQGSSSDGTAARHDQLVSLEERRARLEAERKVAAVVGPAGGAAPAVLSAGGSGPQGDKGVASRSEGKAVSAPDSSKSESKSERARIAAGEAGAKSDAEEMTEAARQAKAAAAARAIAVGRQQQRYATGPYFPPPMYVTRPQPQYRPSAVAVPRRTTGVIFNNIQRNAP